MLSRTLILGFIIAVSFQTQAQQLAFIGLTKEEVKEQLKSEFKMFSPDESVVKQQFNYLKYVNGSETVTWIFYFSENDICTSTKKVCDYTEYDFVLMELNEKCEKVDDAIWEFTHDKRDYTLTLVEEDWYFTVREREKNYKK